MPVIVKFIVSNEENAHKVSQIAKQHFKKVVKDIDIDKEYSVFNFLDKANSFTREWLMSFDVTGEDEDRQEEPRSFAELVSAHIPTEINGSKPLFVEKTIPSTDEGTNKVINRVLEIAAQRRHDIVWAEVPAADTTIIKAYEDAGFKENGRRNNALLFTKEI